MSKRKVTGINIQFPISQLILKGKKTIETRTYPIPEQYVGQEMAIIETPGPAGDFPARVVGLVTFERCFQYKNAQLFYADESKHQVSKNSPWKWNPEKPKWGWVIKIVIEFQKPKIPPRKKGIVYTKNVEV